MASYKNIISGTINNIVEKVKEVADNKNVRSIYENGTGRAKAYGRIAKLSLEINGESEELKHVYTEVGRLYYEQAKDSPEGFFAPLFAQIAGISERISAREEEIAALKAEYASSDECADIDVEIGEFEDIVSATEEEGSGKEE